METLKPPPPNHLWLQFMKNAAVSASANGGDASDDGAATVTTNLFVTTRRSPEVE